MYLCVFFIVVVVNLQNFLFIRLYTLCLLRSTQKRILGVPIIIADCKEGLKRILRVRIQHCFRKLINAPTRLLEEVLLVQMILLFFNSLQLMWLRWLVLMRLEHCMSVSTLVYLLVSFV